MVRFVTRRFRILTGAFENVDIDPDRLKDWFLLDADRYVLAAVVLAVVFALFLWLEASTILEPERDATAMLYLFSALAGGNVTLITIVISINQLILSRELRSPRELQTEIHAAEEFREEVQSETNRVVVPEEPEEFLRILVGDTRRQVVLLGDASDEFDDADLETEIEEFVETLERDLDETTRRLEHSHGGVFPALSTVLDVDFATHMNRGRWIVRSNADTLPDTTQGLLKNLEDHIEQLDVARQYFKTIYIKQELADVSTLVMSTGLLSVVVAMVFIVYTGYLAGQQSVLGNPVLVPSAVTLSLVPLALLISHVFRIATVARRTAAITPFLAPTE